MYQESAAYYDAIYSFKDYTTESDTVRGWIRDRNPYAKNLLDVACGTGKHLEQLRNFYECAGLEYEEEMATICRERNPGVVISCGDMRNFDLGRRFDAITCLFSSIGYVGTTEALDQALSSFARHLVPGGLLIVEPWMFPGQFFDGFLSSTHADTPDLKVSRMCVSRVEKDGSVMDMHHMIGTPDGIYTFIERHELTLFTDEEYRRAFASAGMSVEFLEPGLTGRGVYIGARAT